MTDLPDQVESYYAPEPIRERLFAALADAGITEEKYRPYFLASVDQIHARGIAVTKEMGDSLNLREDMHVVDVGCGLGGAARYLAHVYGCRVTGIDLSREFVAVGQALTKRSKLQGLVEIRHGDALSLPFDDASVDVVWAQHVAMNIADKAGYYAEARRILKPGGKFRISEYVNGGKGTPNFPITWAPDESLSFIETLDEMTASLERAGFKVVEVINDTEETLRALKIIRDRAKANLTGPLSLHLVLGDAYFDKQKNECIGVSKEFVIPYKILAEPAA